MTAVTAMAAVMPALSSALAQIGWVRIAEFDIGICGPGTYRIQIHRSDGRWVRLTAFTCGATYLQRFQRCDVVVRGYGDGPQYNSFEDHYLGRLSCLGPRSGLRALADYMTDNPGPSSPALNRSHARDALRLVARMLPS